MTCALFELSDEMKEIKFNCWHIQMIPEMNIYITKNLHKIVIF